MLTNGRCGIIDLSLEANLMPHDWTMCLEVAEHVPQMWEDEIIRNMHRTNTKGVILSWALEGQGGYGHVNERDNDYVKEKFATLGYVNDVEAEEFLRDSSTLSWFKHSIMVFHKPDGKAQKDEL